MNFLREHPTIYDACRLSIRYVLKERNMRVEALAKEIGISRVALSYFLIGQRILAFSTFERIMHTLGFQDLFELAIYPYMSISRKELHKSWKKRTKQSAHHVIFSL